MARGHRVRLAQAAPAQPPLPHLRANHLQVALPPGDHHDDLTLTATINNALTLGGAVPEGVEAKDGDITLTGSVPAPRGKWRK